jgi:uncharacterized protein YcfJ
MNRVVTIRRHLGGLLLVAAPALAGAGLPADHRYRDASESYYVMADVVSVSPRYGWHEVREPVERCVETGQRWQTRRWDDAGHHRYREPPRYRSGEGEGVAAGLVGGVIGGLIGHQFGGGDGKTALTIAGATLGATVARNHALRQRSFEPDGYRRYATGRGVRDYPVLRCTTAMETRRVRDVDGYDVRYRYNGRTFHKWMDEHPGEHVRVLVSVEPVY